jgi:hypothetical protein
VPTKTGEAPEAAADDVDAGWDEDEQDEGEAADSDGGDVDAGWDAVETAKTPEERERAWRGLTPEQREALTARAAARKDKLRAKSAAKAERRKARASIAQAKQKTKQKIQRPRTERTAPRESDPTGEAAALAESPWDLGSQPRMRARRTDPKVLVILAAILLAAGAIALFLWKR